MRKFSGTRPSDDAARIIATTISDAHAEQHALHRSHSGRLAYQHTASHELLLLAASTVVRIR
ncbi:hypothetical protein F5X71_30710 [Nocardia brasiliensis]|uniref:Uncharacterized protein n=1 Tax=Nocardia brasiliensis TaxID=37326 RepID=A0A6G9XZ19_NOCBR|nr:hypothetical protein [Nocardia brasiliensis]QIS06097.1 hypothetical protein F5X71_30710 [Nocardia brasiliensis]